MIRILSSRLFWGFVLVFGGILLLLDTFGIIKGNALFWTIIAGIAGVLFLSFYFTNRQNWWALIPGVIFLTISLAIGLDEFVPGFEASNISGPIILAGIALSFFLVYFSERSNWWALIPGGVMTTIAIMALLSSNTSSAVSGGVFFIGLGLTFALVAMLPSPSGQMRWPLIPAGILGLIGLLILIAAENLINYIWPVALILAGGWLVWRSMRAR